MLLGQYTHTLDAKKRLSLPSRFRKQIGKRVVLTHGLDSCLFVYSEQEWEKFSERLSELSMGQADTRAFNRFFLGGAVETDVDSQGRILVPDFLKDFAKLKTKVIVVGVHNRIEVWDERLWKAYNTQTEKKADALAEKLGDIGMI